MTLSADELGRLKVAGSFTGMKTVSVPRSTFTSLIQAAELNAELVAELTKARTVLVQNGEMLGLGDIENSPLMAEIDSTLSKAKGCGT